MSAQAPVTTGARPDRADALLRAIAILLAAAVLGAIGLIGVTVWQARTFESTATPALRAIADFEDRVRAEPNNASLRVRYADALGEAGLFPQAVEQYKAATELDDKHVPAWRGLAMVAMLTNDRAVAEQYFNKVIELTEGAQYEAINDLREEAFFHLGEIALDDERFEDAAAFFKESLRMKKDAADTYYLLAQALRGLGSDDEAIENLQTALQFSPKYAEAHFLFGTIAAEKGDMVAAANHLRQASELAPEKKEARVAFAKLGTSADALKRSRDALASGDAKTAYVQARFAVELDPDNHEAIAAYIDSLIARKQLKLAREELKEFAALKPDPALLKPLQAKLK